MERYREQLDWIDRQHDAMCELLVKWSHINSGSHNTEGLSRMCRALSAEFGDLGGEMEEIEIPPQKVVDARGHVRERPLGHALRIRKRPQASLRALLCGHMDTVFGADHPFQKTKLLDANTLNGPGVADLKGGLVAVLYALRALERTGFKDALGFEVLINPDEEIGSENSLFLLKEAAANNHLGLIVEPALSDGTLAGERKGSGNFTVVVRGKAAHAGREHHLGRNAIRALADFITALDRLNGKREGITINVGRIEGGGAVNVVPDLAICHLNVRTRIGADEGWMRDNFDALLSELNGRDGITAQLHGAFTRPPKPMSGGTERLFHIVAECGRELGIEIGWKATGGCCDGNNLAAAGLPNVDTLGVRGGNIHSDREFVLLDSLTERSKLLALLLMKLATGEIMWEN